MGKVTVGGELQTRPIAVAVVGVVGVRRVKQFGVVVV